MSYSYTTASAVQAELQTTTDFSASTVPSLSQVTTWITEESDRINSVSGTVWGSTAYNEVVNWDGSDIIVLKHSPLISLTRLLYTTASIGTSNYGLTNTATANTDYVADNEKSVVHLISGSSNGVISKFKEGLKTIQVDYTAGYATVPERIQMLAAKKTASRVLTTLLNKDMNDANSGGSISVGSISIVEPAEFGTSRFKTLQSDIADLEMDLIKNTGVYRYTNY